METTLTQLATGSAGIRSANTPYKTDIRLRDFELVADEPPHDGGGDLGPTPYELVTGALAACTSITLRMYANRKGWDLGESKVELELTREGDSTPPVYRMTRAFTFDPSLSDEQRHRLMQIAGACPIHKVLTNGVKITDTTL